MSRQRYQVLWTEVAARDLEDIVAYVATDSQINADRLLQRLTTRAESLDVAPLRGRVVPELGRFGMRAWRELLVKPYRIVYRVTGHSVYVLAVFDGRRDLEDVLLERLLRGPHIE